MNTLSFYDFPAFRPLFAGKCDPQSRDFVSILNVISILNRNHIQNGLWTLFVLLWDLNPTPSASKAIALLTRPHHPWFFYFENSKISACPFSFFSEISAPLLCPQQDALIIKNRYDFIEVDLLKDAFNVCRRAQFQVAYSDYQNDV